ncbi:unnamed protein product [Microthlaspi erraticum]|uniref:F-box domain-containing protein n=1 Tax=Microthlaspi erraticum TaxID=1685480 RepID=A0A6D2LII0_9BRAS|nr:unnamed protein product [Microthlaspi erraticum]
MEAKEEKEICNHPPDVISKLPDALISQILSYLPTKEAVRTSVLSDRWKSLWLLTPTLELASNEVQDYNAFVSIVDKSLGFCREEKSCLHKLKLLIIQKDENDPHCLTRWIDFVAKRKVKHIDVDCFLVRRELMEVMPLSLYVCETLLHLRLHRVVLGSFESVSLPCVKTMYLEQNVYANEKSLESLISSCPVLKDLIIVRMLGDNVKVLRVHSQSLTSVTIGFELGQSRMWFYRYNREILGLSVDAPRLKYLNFNDDVSRSQILSNFSPSVRVNLGGGYIPYFTDGNDLSKKLLVSSFFYAISRVTDLIISENTMRLISSCFKGEALPQLCNLSCLEANVCLIDVEILSRLFDSSPRLKSFVLNLTHPTVVDSDPTSFWFVPQCFFSSLEFVEIKCCYNGERVAMRLASYFAENSVALKKFVLRWTDHVLEEDSVLRDLHALSWRARTCEVEAFGPPKSGDSDLDLDLDSVQTVFRMSL